MITARWTTARAVSRGADFRSSADSPIFSPEKESTGSVASLQTTVSEFAFAFAFEFECEFVVSLIGNLNLLCVWVKNEEEKNEREVEVGVIGVKSEEAILRVSVSR